MENQRKRPLDDCSSVTNESEKQKISQFEDLPNETILKIFKYLDIEDLLQCGQLSKRFRTISRDGTVEKAGTSSGVDALLFAIPALKVAAEIGPYISRNHLH